MAITISPQYPLPGETVTIAESSAVGEVQVVEITSAPSESLNELGYLTVDTDTPINGIFDIAENNVQSNQTTFDEPGEYDVTVYDLRKWIGIPSFPTDQSGEERWEIIASYTGSLHVSAPVTLPLLTGSGHGATLQLAINDDTVRAASLIDPTDDKSYIASIEGSVLSELAAIVGSSVSSMGTDLQTGVNNLRLRYEAHRKRALVPPPSVHLQADSTNVTPRTDADSQEGAISLLNELRIVILQHYEGSITATRPWHNEDDLKNIPLAQPATSLATATVLSADLRERGYERHRVQVANPACHNNPDNTNSLNAPSLLDNIIVSYFDALAAIAPTAVVNEPMGAIETIHRYGFEVE